MKRTLQCTYFRLVLAPKIQLVCEENVKTAQNDHSLYSSIDGSNSRSIMQFSLCWPPHEWKPGAPPWTDVRASGGVHVMGQTADEGEVWVVCCESKVWSIFLAVQPPWCTLSSSSSSLSSLNHLGICDIFYNYHLLIVWFIDIYFTVQYSVWLNIFKDCH